MNWIFKKINNHSSETDDLLNRVNLLFKFLSFQFNVLMLLDYFMQFLMIVNYFRLLDIPIGCPFGPHQVNASKQILIEVIVRFLIHKGKLTDAASQYMQIFLCLVGLSAHLVDQLAQPGYMVMDWQVHGGFEWLVHICNCSSKLFQ